MSFLDAQNSDIVYAHVIFQGEQLFISQALHVPGSNGEHALGGSQSASSHDFSVEVSSVTYAGGVFSRVKAYLGG